MKLSEVPQPIKVNLPWQLKEDARAGLKKYVADIITRAGMRLTGSSRGGYHIRFPMQGGLTDFQKFFKKYGITVVPNAVNISGSYETYILQTTKEINNIPPATELAWVNNYIGKDSSSGKQFGPKQLTPEDIGLADQRFDQGSLLSAISKNAKSKYPEHSNLLIQLAKKSTGSGSTISLSGIDLSPYNASDLTTISKNYGEVLAGLWALNNLDFSKMYFPKISNLALIDIYGEKDGEDFPISVKSGGGGKVTIQNILDALEDKVREGKVKPEEQKSYVVFETVKKNGAREGILALNKYFKTKPIKELSKLMKTPIEDINLQTMKEWLDSYGSNNDIKKAIEPFLQSMKTKLTDAIWQRNDRIRFIISPLGEWTWKFLNANDDIRGSMTDLARQLSLIQVNADIKQSSLVFRHNRFEDAEFIFGWAGYAAGNKLGFKMKLNSK